MSIHSENRTCPQCEAILRGTDLYNGQCWNCNFTFPPAEDTAITMAQTAGPSVSILHSFKFAWRMLLHHFGIFLAVFLILSTIQILQMKVTGIIPPEATAALWAIIFGGMLIGMIVQLGLYKFGIHMAEDKEADLGLLLRQSGYFLQYLIASFLFGCMVFVGFILLIVPGVYVMIKFQFFGYLVVDKDCGPVEALRKSFHLTKGVEGLLFQFGLVVFAFNLIGTLISTLGAFVTMPLTLVATAHLYVQLRKQQFPEPAKTADES